MAVRRVVANIAVDDPAGLARFYRDVIGLETAMDMGWIVTLGGEGTMRPQLSLMSEGGSSAPVPDLSIEVDDLEAVLERCCSAGYAPQYGPAQEPWGVRRFFVRDPSGRLVNILVHE